jgi:hypothetical protein
MSLERENRKEQVWSIILERISYRSHWCWSTGHVKKFGEKEERKDVAFENDTSSVTCFLKGF